ncbi:MAG: hypothetical protein M1828_006927 [Chrysothrix sp. TS-e1954]|nr:MAG: hypothetical protein M1828_006927 [Chrysothrix sp. TS-e1954]
MSLPTTMKAIKSPSQGKTTLSTSTPLPKLDKPGYVLVKVSTVALNPTDWKSADKAETSNHTVGCDYCGTVVEVGQGVTKDFKKGDRIAGFIHGIKSNDTESGSFAEYAKAKADVQMKVPDNMPDDEAATVGIGIITVGQGMYQSLQLPMPDQPAKEKFPLLIYGGSTSTGIFAIQYAKLSGLTVVVTCSPKNFDLVKSYGADAAFDYSDPEKCAKDIKDYTKNNLKYAYDCISEGTSPQICANALADGSGAMYSALLPVADFPRSDVKQNMTLGYTQLGEAFSFFGNEVPAKPEDFEFAKKFWTLAEKLVAEGKIKAKHPDVRSGGLNGVFGGLDELRQGKVSGRKLVYKVGETN